MVVLVGLVIVAAAVVPAMQGAGRRGDLDSAAARVAASARFAREAAVERQETVGLMVEPEARLVRLVRQPEIEAGSAADLAATPTTTPASPTGEEKLQAPLPARFAAVSLPSGVIAHLEPAPMESIGAAPTPGAALADGVLRFTPDGRSTGGVVVLTGERGQERRVLVSPETGVVRVEDGNGE